MKVQAQDLKVGMVIKSGNWKGVITEAPVQSDYKKSDVKIMMDVFPAKIKRKFGEISIVSGGVTDVYFRNTTMIQTY